MTRWILFALLLVPGAGLAIAGEAGEAGEATEKALQARIKDLIADLGAEEWKDREKASVELIKIGKPAVHALKKAMKNPDPEVRIRARTALQVISSKAAREVEEAQGKDAPPPRARPEPFPLPEPFNRDFADWIKKMLEDPARPGAPPGRDGAPDLIERVLKALREQNRAHFQVDGSQKSVFTKNGETVEVERDGAGKVKVSVRAKDPEGKETVRSFEAPSEKAFIEKHPEAWEKYVKGRFAPFRIQVLRPGDPFDDWWKDFDKDFRRFRKRWDPEKRWKEMEERMRRMRRALPQGRGGGGAQHVVIQDRGSTIEWIRRANGHVTLKLRKIDKNGNTVEDLYQAQSEEEFEKKHPKVHAEYVLGKIGNGRVRIELGQGFRKGPGLRAPGLGIRRGDVSPLMRAHLDIEEGVGFVVNGVIPGSPADRAGLEKWDLVLRAGGAPVTDPAGIEKALEASGAPVELEIIRRGEPMTLKIGK